MNMMPLATARKLNLKVITETKIALEWIDGLRIRPKWVIKDITILLGQFNYPYDFLVMEMQKENN